MASTPDAPAPESPACLENDHSTPPGWARKLVPSKGKGLTPNKQDVVYIAPDGEEIKSKTHLQRYLKAHPCGLVVSHFNWSSGETPRRSSRLTSKTPTGSVDAEVTPESGKRNVIEISDETKENAAALLSPPKRVKKTVEELASDEKYTGGDSALVARNEETMEDVEKQEENLPSGERAQEATAANGDLVVQGEGQEERAGEQGGEENGSNRFVVDNTIEPVIGKESKVTDVGKEKVDALEPVSVYIGKTQEVLERATGQSVEIPEQIKDKVMENLVADAENGEPHEPLPEKVIEIIPKARDASHVVEFDKKVVLTQETALSNNKEETKLSLEKTVAVEKLCHPGEAHAQDNSETQAHSSSVSLGVTN